MHSLENIQAGLAILHKYAVSPVASDPDRALITVEIMESLSSTDSDSLIHLGWFSVYNKYGPPGMYPGHNDFYFYPQP